MDLDVFVTPGLGDATYLLRSGDEAVLVDPQRDERRRNPLLRVTDLAGFTADLTGELMAHPAYYADMAPINRAGAPVLGRLPDVAAMRPDHVAQAQRGGVWVLDGRDRNAYAAAHLPGSLNIELNAGFASYVGWMLPFDAPILLILPEPEERSLAEATTQLVRIGWSRFVGYLRGGVASWRAAGGELTSFPVESVEQLCEAQRGDHPLVLDVRQTLEWNWGTVPGSRRIFVADLPKHLADLPRTEPVWVICSNGHRASIAASLLDRAGITPRLIGTGGVGEWRTTCRNLPTANV
ncbi:MAG: rhodanese-like domain-containing protein [Betaproteobacteria bacterium]